MLKPFIDVILLAIHFLEIALFVWIILGLLVHFEVINARQPLIARIRHFLDSVFNPLLAPIRKRLPHFGGFDLSPVALILLLFFIQRALVHWF
jgi:YggT family protein